MILMNTLDVIRSIAGAYRVQMLQMAADFTSAEASALDFLFRDQLYEQYDYTPFAEDMMRRVPEDGLISYRDEFGLHYLVFRGRDTEAGSFLFLGPYVHHAHTEKEFRELMDRYGLEEESLEALRWFFRRVPVITDFLSWRHLMLSVLSRYTANPNLEIQTVRYQRQEKPRPKPVASLAAIPYTSIEARYAVEAAMLAAVRRGDFAEAAYQQNLFMGFTLDRRCEDPLRDAQDMVIAVNTLFRKTVEQAEVHPLYIDDISGQFVREIERVENEDQLVNLIPRMINNYCLLVQNHSLRQYSEGIRNCINYIDFHYMEPLNLESLATRFSLNKNYLSSRFHREVGMTVTDYINRTRVRKSEELLSRSAENMQGIAEKCGFTDANYFSRIFRKVNGETPLAFRKRNLK